jgi:glyoxylase-like metal-dependent hydrolase (beta-lactamase superfamily II)
MQVVTFPVGPLAANCSIVIDPASRSAVVIDPGGDFDRIKAWIERASAEVVAILHTHVHIDHVGATAALRKWSGAPARIHEADRFLYETMPFQAVLLGMHIPDRCDVVGDLVDGCVVRAGSLELSVMHTPGHTPGSVSFVLKGDDATTVFTGDTLFRHGIGRTDLWGGDEAQILQSIRSTLFALSDDAVVIPGHGPKTTIGEERRHNPFVRS